MGAKVDAQGRKMRKKDGSKKSNGIETEEENAEDRVEYHARGARYDRPNRFLWKFSWKQTLF